MCLAPAVAFATGGATLEAVTGLSYPVCTVIIGVFIFVVSIFGSKLVRRVASVLSVVIIAGLLIVYIPNIIIGGRQNFEFSDADVIAAGFIWKGFIFCISVRYISADQYCGVCTACGDILRTEGSEKKYGDWICYQFADDGAGCSRPSYDLQ